MVKGKVAIGWLIAAIILISIVAISSYMVISKGNEKNYIDTFNLVKINTDFNESLHNA